MLLAGLALAGVCVGQDTVAPAEGVYVEVEPDQTAPAEPPPPPPGEADDDPAPPVVQPPSQLPAWSQRYPELINPRQGGQEGDSAGGLLDRQTIPVTEPAEGDSGEGPALPVAGSILSDRLCRVSKDEASGWVLATFPPEEGLPDETPRWALPNRMLAEMVRTAEDRPDAVFRVTGENTIYKGRPFILLQMASIESQRVPAGAGDSSSDSDDGEDGSIDGRLDSDAILMELLRDRPGEPVLPETSQPYEQREQAPSAAPEGDEEQVYHPGRGNMVIDRIIVVMPTGHGEWMEAAFESDNTGNEPPLRLLPSSMLAQAEGLAASKPMEAVRFHVSGEITEYHERRYLLIRKLIEQRDMGGP